MKKFVSNIQTLVIFVLIILVLMKTCGGPSDVTEVEKIVTKIETRYDTLEIEKKSMFRSIKLVLYLKDYYSKYVYKDTLKLDSLGYITIIDTITQNKIFSRNFDSQVLIPTTTITNDIYLNKAKFFGGVSIGGNKSQINFLSGDLLYKSKSDNVYGLGLGVNENLQPIITGRMYWRIRFKKDKK